MFCGNIFLSPFFLILTGFGKPFNSQPTMKPVVSHLAFTGTGIWLSIILSCLILFNLVHVDGIGTLEHYTWWNLIMAALFIDTLVCGRFSPPVFIAHTMIFLPVVIASTVLVIVGITAALVIDDKILSEEMKHYSPAMVYVYDHIVHLFIPALPAPLIWFQGMRYRVVLAQLRKRYPKLVVFIWYSAGPIILGIYAGLVDIGPKYMLNDAPIHWVRWTFPLIGALIELVVLWGMWKILEFTQEDISLMKDVIEMVPKKPSESKLESPNQQETDTTYFDPFNLY